MACLDILEGAFGDGPAWQDVGDSPGTTDDGTVTVTIVEDSGGFDGVTITRGSGSSHTLHRLPNGRCRFMIFGTPAKYILVLMTQHELPDPSGPASEIIERHVHLIDLTGSGSIVSHLLSASNPRLEWDSPFPSIKTSAGKGQAFLLVTTGTLSSKTSTTANIYRSDNGTELVPGLGYSSSDVLGAEATPTHLRIISGSRSVSRPRPATGNWNVEPERHVFDTVTFRSGHHEAPTRTFTISNPGVACLYLRDITPREIPPFSVTSIEPGLNVAPDDMDNYEVTVTFSPTRIGTYEATFMLSPTAGEENSLNCYGKAQNVPYLDNPNPGRWAFVTPTVIVIALALAALALFLFIYLGIRRP